MEAQGGAENPPDDYVTRSKTIVLIPIDRRPTCPKATLNFGGQIMCLQIDIRAVWMHMTHPLTSFGRTSTKRYRRRSRILIMSFVSLASIYIVRVRSNMTGINAKLSVLGHPELKFQEMCVSL